MPYTKFMDMHSGGSRKVGFDYIYIKADAETAGKIFEQIFNYNPYGTTCDCCGEDYSIDEYETLEEATFYEREYHHINSVEEYFKNPSVKLIEEI